MNDRPTPASQGYRMPAEWEPHSGTWLAWPHNPETWPGQDMSRVEQVYLEIIRALTPYESVYLLVQDPTAEARIAARLEQEGIPREQVKLYAIVTDDTWIRDYGPNFLVRQTPAGKQTAWNKWLFDAWGGKYEWENDNRAGDEIARRLGLPRFDPGIVLEGGAVEVNGRGTCLTTASCLLNPNRNGGMNRNEMEDYLKDYLGVRKIIWLGGEIEGDDTDGHIDNLARFVNPTTIVCTVDPSESHSAGLKNNLQTLRAATDQDGEKFTVIPLPVPERVGDAATPLPASYANFYIGNGAVLVPTYNQASDSIILKLLKPLFPNREIVGIPCQTLIWGLGGIHCITQQQPV